MRCGTFGARAHAHTCGWCLTVNETSEMRPFVARGHRYAVGRPELIGPLRYVESTTRIGRHNGHKYVFTTAIGRGISVRPSQGNLARARSRISALLQLRVHPSYNTPDPAFKYTPARKHDFAIQSRFSKGWLGCSGERNSALGLTVLVKTLSAGQSTQA